MSMSVLYLATSLPFRLVSRCRTRSETMSRPPGPNEAYSGHQGAATTAAAANRTRKIRGTAAAAVAKTAVWKENRDKWHQMRSNYHGPNHTLIATSCIKHDGDALKSLICRTKQKLKAAIARTYKQKNPQATFYKIRQPPPAYLPTSLEDEVDLDHGHENAVLTNILNFKEQYVISSAVDFFGLNKSCESGSWWFMIPSAYLPISPSSFVFFLPLTEMVQVTQKLQGSSKNLGPEKIVREVLWMVGRGFVGQFLFLAPNLKKSAKSGWFGEYSFNKRLLVPVRASPNLHRTCLAISGPKRA